MGTHRKFFPVSKMPWHTDDHKFGEGDGPFTVLDDEHAGIFEPLPEPPIDSFIDSFQRITSTVCLVDGGRCFLCRAEAVYGYRSRLYCATCWLEMDGDNG